ncbi:MAG: CpaF family protein [Firmicutes bacterium]|nr:CpaF family protein [Bacillota bacterium]
MQDLRADSYHGADIESLIEKARTAVHLAEGISGDDAVLTIIEQTALQEPALSNLDAETLSRLTDRIFLALRRDLYVLDPLMENENVTEIMVNGPEEVFVEIEGRIQRVPVSFESESALLEVIRRIASRVGREINELHPIVDARTKEGSRVNAVYGNIALNGPVLTIRKFPPSGYTMADLIAFGTLTEECASYLGELVRTGYNLFISGGTSSGKTTFLNVLSEFIEPDERVIVIEDSAELALRGVPDLVRMECRRMNAEGKGAVDMSQLIRTSLRMRPDRIIVGEVRGAEVVDMINAMNTGHDGSLSTGHGNSVRGMLRRLESMFLQQTRFPIEAIRSQIAEGIDVIVHLGRLRDRRRVVLDVEELYLSESGQIELNPLFSFDREKGLCRTDHPLRDRTKWERNGGREVFV